MPIPQTTSEDERVASVRETTRRFAEERVRPRAESLDETETFPARPLPRVRVARPLRHHRGGGARRPRRRRAYLRDGDGGALPRLRVGRRPVRPDRARRHAARRRTGRRRRSHATCRRCCAPSGAARTRSPRPRPAPTSPASGPPRSRDGDGWRLTGQKLWIHNAPVADFALVLARTDPRAGHRGMSIFIVDLDVPGCSRGKKEHKMGQRASQVGALFFDDVRCRGRAARPAGTRLPRDDERAREGSRRHRRARRRHPAGRARGLRRLREGPPSVRQADRGLPGDPVDDRRHGEGHRGRAAAGRRRGREARPRRARDARVLDGEVLRQRRRGRCTRRMRCRSTAAAATSAASIVERLYRDAKITQIYEGTNQIQRMIIARQILAD